jgi:hypothetical protein
MNLKQINRLNMIEAVIAYLSFYTEYIAESTGLGETLEKVKTLADAIRAKDNEKSGATTGKSIKKKNSGKELRKQVIKISSALFIWAKKNNEEEIKALASISKSEFKQKRDADKVNTAKAIFNAANGKDLAFAKVTVEDITRLDTLADEFKDNIVGLSSGASKRAAAGQSLDDMVDEAMKILNEEMDKYMIQFSEEQSEFYNGYKSARVIWDKGGRHAEQVPEEEPAEVN